MIKYTKIDTIFQIYCLETERIDRRSKIVTQIIKSYIIEYKGEAFSQIKIFSIQKVYHRDWHNRIYQAVDTFYLLDLHFHKIKYFPTSKVCICVRKSDSFDRDETTIFLLFKFERVLQSQEREERLIESSEDETRKVLNNKTFPINSARDCLIFIILVLFILFLGGFCDKTVFVHECNNRHDCLD